jgi:hypothetical protein
MRSGRLVVGVLAGIVLLLFAGPGPAPTATRALFSWQCCGIRGQRAAMCDRWRRTNKSELYLRQ